MELRYNESDVTSATGPGLATTSRLLGSHWPLEIASKSQPHLCLFFRHKNNHGIQIDLWRRAVSLVRAGSGRECFASSKRTSTRFINVFPLLIFFTVQKKTDQFPGNRQRTRDYENQIILSTEIQRLPFDVVSADTIPLLRSCFSTFPSTTTYA